MKKKKGLAMCESSSSQSKQILYFYMDPIFPDEIHRTSKTPYGKPYSSNSNNMYSYYGCF